MPQTLLCLKNHLTGTLKTSQNNSRPLRKGFQRSACPSEHLQTKTVKVSNLSARATEHDIRDFFSFSGEIEHIELQSEGDGTKAAFVTFKFAEALETAVLLSGATIVDQPVIIAPVEDYLCTTTHSMGGVLDTYTTGGTGGAVTRAQDVITTMLAKGYMLGKDALSKAKNFDEKHQLTANATATVSSFDKRIGISEKLSAGTALVNEHVKALDQKYQVSEMTRSAFAVAEEKVNHAGSALLKNKYLFTGASWVTGAFTKVAKAAGEVGERTMEKVHLSESQRKEHTSGSSVVGYDSEDISHDFSGLNVWPSEPAAILLSSVAENARQSNIPNYDSSFHRYYSSTSTNNEHVKPPPAQGLIL